MIMREFEKDAAIRIGRRWQIGLCHGRSWAGHPRFSFAFTKMWVAGPRPAMTRGESPAMARTRPLVTDMAPIGRCRLAAASALLVLGLSISAQAAPTQDAGSALAALTMSGETSPAVPPATSVAAPLMTAQVGTPTGPAATGLAQAGPTQAGMMPTGTPPTGTTPTATAPTATTATGMPPTGTGPDITPPAAAPATAGTPVTAPTPSVSASLLPQDLSVSAMFLHADVIVRSVMIGLMGASVVTWTMLLAKGLELIQARRQIGRELTEAEAHETLAELVLRTSAVRNATATMAAAAAREMALSGDTSREGLKERIASRLRRIESQLGRRMNRGTGWLATIGATAPFIGLFGTVWGIMNSFIGISRSQTTNLAVVAPGIAEALLATAAGLIAAIPAVVIYNLFARGIGGYRANVADLAATVERLASRDVDAHRTPLKAAAE
jgi:biopolymer transport protein ExbB